VGARLTFALVIVAAVTLVAGYATHTPIAIYVSIVCSVLAGVGLWLSSRRRRAQGRVAAEDDMDWTKSLAEPPVTAGIPAVVGASASFDSFAPERPAPVVGGRKGRRAAKVAVGAGASPASAGPPPARRFDLPGPRDDDPRDDDLGDHELGDESDPVDDDWDDLDDDGELDDEPAFAPAPTRRRYARAGAVATPPSEAAVPAPGGATPSRRPPKRSPVASDWVQSARQPTPPAPPVAPPAAAPAPRSAAARSAPAGTRARRPAEPAAPAVAVAAPAVAPRAGAPRSVAPRPAPAAAAPVARRRPRPPVEDYPFPIEDYDYLEVEDIIPLLRHLDDQELVEVLLREKSGANRVEILDHLDVLLEGEDW
jgi:hypothetical protein